MKKIIKPLSISFISIILLTFIITIFSYFDIISEKVVNIFSYIVPFISFFIGGFLIGKKSHTKGWLEGLKLATIDILILIVLNILLNNYSISNIIKYIIVLISNILGAILGINKKAI